jgi:hypothetical protein
MFNSDTELLFPIRVISSLKNIRGGDWNSLVDRVSNPESPQEEKIAFSAMIIRLAGCQGCDADSFRAMRGCTQCAKMIVKRYKGSDSELLEQFSQGKKDVIDFLDKRKNK